MKILFLGPNNSPLVDWLQSIGEVVVAMSDPIDLNYLERHKLEFLISYGYRHILRKEILSKFSDNRAINLHISLLPWNRGADPNFWSIIDGTPKGVTVHYIDEGVDTGDIIVQKEIKFIDGMTLKTSYEKLHDEIQSLFKNNWSTIRNGTCPRMKQGESGSTHRLRDKEKYLKFLTNGWDTPLKKLENLNN